MKALITSPEIAFRDYPTPNFTTQKVIEVMISDLVKIKLYGGKFMSVQHIPTRVWKAAKKLVLSGYDGDLNEELGMALFENA